MSGEVDDPELASATDDDAIGQGILAVEVPFARDLQFSVLGEIADFLRFLLNDTEKTVVDWGDLVFGETTCLATFREDGVIVVFADDCEAV